MKSPMAYAFIVKMNADGAKVQMRQWSPDQVAELPFLSKDKGSFVRLTAYSSR